MQQLDKHEAIEEIAKNGTGKMIHSVFASGSRLSGRGQFLSVDVLS
jgi:hypothetical protein